FQAEDGIRAFHVTGVQTCALPISAVLGPALQEHNLVTRQGEALFTLNGNRVALGSGYPGAAPDGTVEPGVAWVYATGAMFYYRSYVVVTRVDSIDRSKNTIEAMAERHYVIGWDCCLLAAPISTGGVVTGAFNMET